MSSSTDPRDTGSLPSADQQASDADSASSSKWIFAQPGTVSPNNPLPPPRPVKRARLRGRALWLVICGLALLAVVLGVIFTVPLDMGAQGKTTLAGAIGNAVTNRQATPSVSPFTPGTYTATDGRLFSNNSPWNIPIGTNVQLDPHSSNMVSRLGDCCHVPAMFDFGMPIYTSTASDPTYTVQDNGNDKAFEENQPIHIPNDAAPSPGSDHWMFIYDKTKNLIFEMWQAQKQDGTWTTNTGNVYSPTGDGVLQVDGSEQSGNGASYFGGVITYADIERGYINHALSLATRYTSTSWRYPMNASDGQGTASYDLPMGARLQLDPSVDCNTLPGASIGEKMICQALQTYGGYVRDTGGVTLSMYFEGENLSDPNRNPPDGSPGNAGRKGTAFAQVGLRDGEDLAAIPWDKMRVLQSWNSFTALTAPPAEPSASAPSSSVLTENTTLSFPNVTHFALTESASRRELHI